MAVRLTLVAGIGGIVAERARRAGIAGRGAIIDLVAELAAVTEQPVVRTVGLIGQVDAATGNAGVVGATDAVAAITVW
jgi:hypothetical protein